MSVALHHITNRILQKWVEVTGVDPSEERSSWSWGEYSIRETNEYIISSQDIDPTGLTAFMVVRAVVRQYLSEHTYDALTLIDGDEDVEKQLSSFRELHRLVSDEEALEAVREFQSRLRHAADHYGVGEKCEELIEDMSQLAHIRRDALVCPTMLDRHTFRKGASSASSLKYNSQIFQFWNMNSLIRAAQAQAEEGITIVLMVDPQVIEYSFCCFLVRDGENISMWTDAEKSAHPMQKHMSRARGRGRRFEARAARLRFPYELLNVDVRDGYAHQKDTQDIVRINATGAPVAKFSDMEADQLLWAIMALDVLRKEKHADELSVTGEGMVALPPGSTRALPPGFCEALTLTSSHVSSQSMREQLEENGRTSTGVNDWMEERYAHVVDDRILNLVEAQVEEEEEEPEDDDPFSDTWSNNDMQALVTTARETLDYKAILPAAEGFAHKRQYLGSFSVERPSLIGMDPVAFGTREEMEADRLWIARWNQAQALSMAAQAEFEERRQEVHQWFDEHVRANEDQILEAATKTEWIEEFERPLESFGSAEDKTTSNLLRYHRRVARQGLWWPFSYVSPDHAGQSGVVNLAKLPESTRSRFARTKSVIRSYLSEERANTFVLFQPKTAVGIAMLAGCEVGDLPEPLQHWLSDPPYDGNSILDRTDPLDTAVGNPWRAFRFEVRLGLSKRDWNRLVKKHGRSEIDWEAPAEEDGYRFWAKESSCKD